VAAQNIAAANLVSRIALVHADAKSLPFHNDAFDAVISNSIVHHIPNPRDCLAEAVRLTAPGGLLFHRDLARPHDNEALSHVVNTYASEATVYQRRLFAHSLHAALTLDEIRALIATFGVTAETVQMTSDRHWTWTSRK
jgi:ubiquinone/menaquinone biosynthesis C-methylase UbiE